MNHLFIFGAGASKEAGGPLMYDFLDKAQDLLRLNTCGVIEAKREFDMVFEAVAELQAIHAKAFLDLNNLEVLFGAIEMGKLLRKLGTRTPDQIQELHNALITLIYKTLECSIAFPVRQSSGGPGYNSIVPPKPYDSFASIIKDVLKNEPSQDPSRFSFISFNYDLCLDFTLNFVGLGYDYCLNGKRSTGRIPLLKLHGSINWGMTEDDLIVPYHIDEVRFDLHDASGTVQYDLGSSLTRKEHDGQYLKGPPVIIPPTWNKHGYHKQLAEVWAVAAEEISMANNIIIIGFSMPETDSFFRYLYALGSESRARIRNFVVVNPDEDGMVEKRFRTLIGKGIEGRFRFIRQTFRAAIGDIRNILLNP